MPSGLIKWIGWMMVLVATEILVMRTKMFDAFATSLITFMVTNVNYVAGGILMTGLLLVLCGMVIQKGEGRK